MCSLAAGTTGTLALEAQVLAQGAYDALMRAQTITLARVLVSRPAIKP